MVKKIKIWKPSKTSGDQVKSQESKQKIRNASQIRKTALKGFKFLSVLAQFYPWYNSALRPLSRFLIKRNKGKYQILLRVILNNIDTVILTEVSTV